MIYGLVTTVIPEELATDLITITIHDSNVSLYTSIFEDFLLELMLIVQRSARRVKTVGQDKATLVYKVVEVALVKIDNRVLLEERVLRNDRARVDQRHSLRAEDRVTL